MMSHQRVPADKEYAHERLGTAAFSSALSNYDSRRRVQVLIDDFLSAEPLKGQRVLDVGCGLGFFSKRLAELGAKVTAVDIGPTLVEWTGKTVGCRALVADALRLTHTFPDETFDGVISSECIEHTPSPDLALQQMAALLRPGGWLSISTPNRLWLPLVSLATRMRIRPFEGYEHFNTLENVRSVLTKSNVEVMTEKGLHLWPFQLPFKSASTWCDDHAQVLRRLMINICVFGRKI